MTNHVKTVQLVIIYIVQSVINAMVEKTAELVIAMTFKNVLFVLKAIIYQQLILVFYVQKSIHVVPVTMNTIVLSVKLVMFFQVVPHRPNVSNVMLHVLLVSILLQIENHVLQDI